MSSRRVNLGRRFSDRSIRRLDPLFWTTAKIRDWRGNHVIVVESFKVGGAGLPQAGMPAVRVTPTLNPLKNGRGEMNPAGPRLPIKRLRLALTSRTIRPASYRHGKRLSSANRAGLPVVGGGVRNIRTCIALPDPRTDCSRGRFRSSTQYF